MRRMQRCAGPLFSCALVVTTLIGATGFLSTQTAEAATSGWYIAAVPGTGSDDVLVGSTCANALQCWAVGITLLNLGGSQSFPNPLMEAWNGTTWTLVPMPLPDGEGGGLFGATCVSGSDCWAVGGLVASGSGNPTGTLIEQWNGTSWSVVPSPTPSGPGVVGAILSSVSCASASSCMAVGYATDINGDNLTDVVEQWDGSSWTIVPSAATGQVFDQLMNVQCLSATNCWAVGNAGPVSQMSGFLPIFPGAVGDQGLIEHWDGSAWSIVASTTEPLPNGGYLSGLQCVGDSDCWASGATTDDTGNASGILMEHWDGTSWSDASASVPDSTAPGMLAGISCVSPTQCWAVGSTGSFNNGGSGPQPQSLVEYWNGSSWSVQPSPNVTALSFLNSVSCVASVGCLADGSTLTTPNGNGDPGLRAFVEQVTFPPVSSQGTLLAARDGGVFAYGTAPFMGSMGGQHLNAPIVGVAPTPDGQGYWLVASDGGVFAFGDARFEGSMGGQHLNAPIVGMTPSRNGQGYWLVAADGGVFAFGNAGFHGSMGGVRLNAPVVAMDATDHGGYWLVASDGGVFSFGGASFYGSAGGTRLNAPVTGVTATPDSQGYWLVASDGGVFAYGDAGFFGSVPGQGIAAQAPVVGITATPTGSGYWIAGANGAVYTYGDATFLGAPNAGHLVAPVAAIASS
ncbi:MAG: hypothetical protein WAL61_16150 [Acidimicrobiales bacterium]